MKTFFPKSLIVAALLGLTCVIGATSIHAQETIVPHSPQSLQSVQSYSDTQLQELVNDLSATPLIWPTNMPNDGAGGTYWSLAHPEWPPLPTTGGSPFWNLTPSHSESAMSDSATSSDSTASTGSSGFYLLDDVDYPPTPGDTNGDGGTNIIYFEPMGLAINTNGLWLQVPTNAYSIASNYFNVLIHNTTNGDFYDVLTKTALLLPQWTVENTVTGAVGNVTPVTLNLNGRTNLFVWARTSVVFIDTQPLTQEVLTGDSVTFSVAATGGDLSYQWTFDGTNISGATSSSYTIINLNAAEAGNYACVITSATGAVTSHTATLTVESGSGDAYQTQPIGQRQDYTFRSGVTYYIGSTVQLYGNTTFQPGAIIKFDYTQSHPSLQILGTVTCKGTAYNPSVLSTIDDNAYGEHWNTNSPQPHSTGVPYLDLSQASGNLSLTNVWFRYADEAVSTPANGRLDVWNGQFFRCNASILNESNGVDSLHNVLFAGCQEAVAASTNSFAIAAENITADVSNLYTASVSPTYVVLTNSIVTGNANGASLKNSTVAPASSNFQTNGAGNYYLAVGSTLHQGGTTNVSPYLLNEFHNKTTYAPIALSEFMSLSGNLTFSLQAPRYTNGPPDEGYYYDAVDYTVAGMTNFGTITVLPGTVIGFRQDLNTSTYWGFNLREESSFVSHGTPTKPIVFTDIQWVQEQFENPCYSLFVPNFEGGTNTPAPAMDFRFCNFYPAANWYEVWAGQNEGENYMASYDSVVNWTMRDCNLYGGWISLGEPDNGSFFGIPYTTFYGTGSVTWDNNLFENEFVNLQPSYYWYDGTINVDMAFSAYNNLFHGEASYFVIASQTSSSGNWTFEDNMFDKMNFYQDTALPLDYDYNGYWPLTAAELQPGYTNQFQVTSTGDGFTDGGHQQVLSYAPPFVVGTFGNYYLSSLTALYEAGSRTAGAAGLAQYTVFTNQTKDATNSPVNIGLHYVAATNNVPLDSDGDGIPDYVEDANGNGIVDSGETDPNNPMTDGVTNDIYNVAYLNTDLSGDGLVGRVKAALGMNPLDPSNPLTMTQVITGDEPDIATFEVPISYNLMTNGGLNLNLEGQSAQLQDVEEATNGNCLLVFNTTYETPGQHFLQAEFSPPSGEGDAVGSINYGQGNLLSFYSPNVVQFAQQTAVFTTSGATLFATTPTCPSANYTIELRDPNNPTSPHIKTFTGTTSNGIIQTNWDLTYDNGVTIFTNTAVDAVFTVTLLDPGTGTNTQRLNQSALVTDGNFDIAYTYNPGVALQEDGSFWYAMVNVVNTLLMPVTSGGGHSNNYGSGYDRYTSERFPGDVPIPGYFSDRPSALNLVTNLSYTTTDDFYFYGHGSDLTLDDGQTSPNHAVIYTYDVQPMLQNYWNPKKGIFPQHPYRFVFLDACETAKSPGWQYAFGVFPIGLTNQPPPTVGPQAFLGWDGIVGGIRNSNNVIIDDCATAYGNTINGFYNAWMSGARVDQCVAAASFSPSLAMPFPVKGNETFVLNGVTYHRPTANLKLIGYPNLTRSGTR